MLQLQRFIRGGLADRQGGAVAEEPNRGAVAEGPNQGGKLPLLRAGFPKPALPEAKIPEFLKAPSARRWRQIALAFLPTIFAMVYFGAIASNRYVSEAQFVIRTPSKQAGNITFGALLQMTGLGQSDDDSYTVEEYLQSRQALHELLGKLPLRQMYDRPGTDVLARYPSIFYGSSEEEFYRYFQWMLDVIHDQNSGITTVRVQAFTPSDANRILETMLQLGEGMVNRLNERISADSIRVAQTEVNNNEKRLVAAELALTDFRDRELMIDPVASSLIESKVEGELGGEESQVDTEIRTMQSSSPDSPQLAALQQKAAALNAQIGQERRQVSGGSGAGLADELSQYEQLVLTEGFAKQALTVATTALESAKSEARRQQLYLERVVEPNMPDYSTEPERLRTIATIFAFNVIFLLVLTTIITGIREHQAGRRH
jgi:capsular polysaccharide transport system permease protein